MNGFDAYLGARLALVAALRTPEISNAVAAAIATMAKAIASDRMILACGCGGSAADAEHFVAELVGRYEQDRRALKAVALVSNPASLTAIANDYGFERVFARQVEALGEPGGVLVALSTSGQSPSVLAAAEAARRRGLGVVGFTGVSGGGLAGLADIAIRVPALEVALVQEAHRTLYHFICRELERGLPAASPA